MQYVDVNAYVDVDVDVCHKNAIYVKEIQTPPAVWPARLSPLSPSPICARSPSPKTTWQGLHLLHILTRYWHLQNGFPQRFTFRKYYIAPGLRFFQISHANTDWQCKYTQNVTWGLNCALLPLENSVKTFLKLNVCTCVFSVHLWCATWFLCLLHLLGGSQLAQVWHNQRQLLAE